MTADTPTDFPSQFVPESFEPGEAFGGVLGKTIELDVLDYLLGFPTKEFNVTDLSREAGISRPSAGKVLKKFLEWGILTESARRGNAGYYRLRDASLHVEAMLAFIGATNEVMFGLSRSHLLVPQSAQGTAQPLASATPTLSVITLSNAASVFEQSVTAGPTLAAAPT